MIAVLLAILALWIASGFGRTLLSRIKGWEPNPAERFAYSGALGLGVAAYGVYLLGLLGLLGKVQIAVWWLVLGVVGAKGMRESLSDAVSGVRNLLKTENRNEKIVGITIWVVLILLGLVTMIAAFLAPTGMQWDAVAYHLADPKLFLQQGRVGTLPTEHHSNFPFIMEMLFLTGLLYADFPLANLFHFLTEILTFSALLGFTRRHLVPQVGWIAALLFATTPVVFWEAGVSYIDIGLGLYVALSAFAVISAVQETSSEKQQPWILLAGLTMGFALGVKYLALLPFLCVGGLLLIKRIPLKQLVVFAVVAGLIASPWYAKNAVVMKNPVYPYLYKVFTQSKYWSADRGATYDSEQQGFGYSHSLKNHSETLRNLLMTPWNLMANADKYSNRGEFTFLALYGGLWAGFAFAFLGLRRVPSAVKMAMGLGCLQVLAWFFVAQVSRYLISFLPLLAIGCAYTAHRLCDTPLKRGIVASVLGGQTLLLMFSLVAIPTSGKAANEYGVLPTVLNLPTMLQNLTSAEGQEARLQREMETYPAIQYIHAHSRPEEGVLLYEETRGFYLNRPYLWANGEHSSFIPYADMKDGTDFLKWCQTNKIRYALINMNYSPRIGDPELPEAPRHQEVEALQKWYVEKSGKPGSWRYLLGDAIKRGLLHSAFAERGVVVLEVGG